jgi:hypothetical protein
MYIFIINLGSCKGHVRFAQQTERSETSASEVLCQRAFGFFLKKLLLDALLVLESDLIV